MPEISDQELINQYLKGDKKTLEILIKKYLKPIYGFVYRYVGGAGEAEDITQEVFVRVWKNIKKFGREKSFKTWIFAIAKNASLDFIKKKKAIPFSVFENENEEDYLGENIADPAPLAPELIDRENMAQILDAATNKLSPKYRMVLFLRYNDHFSFDEIAESLGEPFETIRSRHRRGLIALKKILTES